MSNELAFGDVVEMAELITVVQERWKKSSSYPKTPLWLKPKFKTQRGCYDLSNHLVSKWDLHF